ELVFSKLLGGPGADLPYDVAVDDNGVSYVTGLRATSQTDFPLQEPFLIAVDADGETLFDMTLPFYVFPRSLAVDAQGMVYVAGRTTGEPDAIAALERDIEDAEDGLILKIDPASQQVLQTTILGGRLDDAV